MILNNGNLFVPCPGIDLALSWTYNSALPAASGPLGPKWVHSYDWMLLKTNKVYQGADYDFTNHWIELRTGSDSTWGFRQYGTNDYWECAYNATRITEATNGEYVLSFPGGVQHAYANDGLLREISDAWGNTLTLAYTNGNGTGLTNLLSRVEHDNGQYLQLHYGATDTSNLLDKVETASSNLFVTFAYTDQGKLEHVSEVASGVTNQTTYSYFTDVPGGFYGNSITQRINSLGNMRCYAYKPDTSGWASAECTNMWLNSDSNYSHTVVADVSNNQSTVTYHRSGTNQTLVYDYDPIASVITKITRPQELETEWIYDPVEWDVLKTVGVEFSKQTWAVSSNAYDDHHSVTSTASAYCAYPRTASGTTPGMTITGR